MANFSLLAKLGLDSNAFQSGLRESSKSSKKFSKSVTASFAKVAAALGGVALGKNMVRLAMDAEEVADKFRTVLGPAAEGVNKQITTLMKTIPATRAQLQDTIATVTQMGLAFGMSEKGAGQFAVGMTKISADLASFHNMKPEEVFLKMQAAITGEFEPLKKLGIVINEARLKQEALNLGIGNGKDALNAQAKAVAVQNIVLKDMGAALGNAAQTANSSANRTKFFQAKLEELQTEIGAKMIPVMVKFLQVLDPLVTYISLNIERTLTFTRRILAFTAGVKIASKLIPIFSKGLIAYQAAAKAGATATGILSISLRRLATSIKALMASTGIGLLVVALSEVGFMALQAATKTGEATDDMTSELANLQKEIEDTMSMVQGSTQAYIEGASAQESYSGAAASVTMQLKEQEKAHEDLKDQIAAYYKKVKEVTEAEQDRFIAAKELESLQLRAKGDTKKAEELDKQIEKMKEAIRISREYGVTLEKAVEIVKGIDEKGQSDEEERKEKIASLEEKIKKMKLAAIRAQAAGDKEEQAAMEKRVELAEKIVSLMKEFNISQEEATNIANKTAKAEDITGEGSQGDTRGDFARELTGEALRKAANEAGKGQGTRFERMADGTFQQFVNGRKGRKGGKFTEEQLQQGLEKQIEKDPSLQTLENIEKILQGRLVNE